ncbi:unnamed protein product, partial [Symbiodinium sp. CCMP2592]
FTNRTAPASPSNCSAAAAFANRTAPASHDNWSAASAFANWAALANWTAPASPSNCSDSTRKPQHSRFSLRRPDSTCQLDSTRKPQQLVSHFSLRLPDSTCQPDSTCKPQQLVSHFSLRLPDSSTCKPQQLVSRFSLHPPDSTCQPDSTRKPQQLVSHFSFRLPDSSSCKPQQLVSRFSLHPPDSTCQPDSTRKPQQLVSHFSLRLPDSTRKPQQLVSHFSLRLPDSSCQPDSTRKPKHFCRSRTPQLQSEFDEVLFEKELEQQMVLDNLAEQFANHKRKFTADLEEMARQSQAARLQHNEFLRGLDEEYNERCRRHKLELIRLQDEEREANERAKVAKTRASDTAAETARGLLQQKLQAKTEPSTPRVSLAQTGQPVQHQQTLGQPLQPLPAGQHLPTGQHQQAPTTGLPLQPSPAGQHPQAPATQPLQVSPTGQHLPTGQHPQATAASAGQPLQPSTTGQHLPGQHPPAPATGQSLQPSLVGQHLPTGQHLQAQALQPATTAGQLLQPSPAELQPTPSTRFFTQAMGNGHQLQPAPTGQHLPTGQHHLQAPATGQPLQPSPTGQHLPTGQHHPQATTAGHPLQPLSTGQHLPTVQHHVQATTAGQPLQLSPTGEQMVQASPTSLPASAMSESPGSEATVSSHGGLGKVSSSTHPAAWQFLYRLTNTVDKFGNKKCSEEMWEAWREPSKRDKLLHDFVHRCWKPQETHQENKEWRTCLVGYEWLTEREMRENHKWDEITIAGAKEYCQKRKLFKKCLYSPDLKFLVQTSDKVETGTSRTKSLEQELADSGLWDTEWSVGDVLGLDDATEGAGEGNNKPTKLVEFPEPEGSETLQEYLGQYKKAALNKKAVLKSTKERLVKDNAVGHQKRAFVGMCNQIRLETYFAKAAPKAKAAKSKAAKPAETAEGAYVQALSSDPDGDCLGAVLDAFSVRYFRKGVIKHPFLSVFDFARLSFGKDASGAFGSPFVIWSRNMKYLNATALHWKAMHLTRHHVKKDICPHCDANITTVPFEDMSADAAWISTIGRSQPWTKPPVFAALPGGDTSSFIRLDTFHLGALGVGQYLAPSVLGVLIAQFKHFTPAASKQRDIESRLAVAHEFFLAFCNAKKRCPRDLKDFTKSNMHWPDQATYPMLSCKAADTILMLEWLEDYMVNVPLDLSDRLLKLCSDALTSYNAFFRLCHHSESRVWWTAGEAATGLMALTTFLRSYHAAAVECYQRRWSYFNFVPKMHYLAHVAFDVYVPLSKGKPVYNPSLWATQMAEDYVGSMCKMSSNTNPSNVARRGIDKYLVRARRVWLKEAAEKQARAG